VERPNNTSYVWGEKKYVGKPAFLQALKDNPTMREDIIKELIRRDLAGTLPASVDSLEESA
jgi:hypothetical protein